MADFIDTKAIAGRIQDFLAENGCTAKEFATRCELPPSTLSQILNEKARINVENINKIVQHMPEIDPMWLVLGHTAGRLADLPQLSSQTSGESDQRYAVLYKRLEEQAAEITRLRLSNEELKKSDIDRIVIYRKDSRFATYTISED